MATPKALLGESSETQYCRHNHSGDDPEPHVLMTQVAPIPFVHRVVSNYRPSMFAAGVAGDIDAHRW